MDRGLTLAILAAVVNVVLSVLIPCIMKKSEEPKGSLLSQIRLTFLVHRHMLLVSSLVTAIAVYLAVKIEPEVKNIFPSGILNFLE